MPFDDREQKEIKPKTGLKPIVGQKSMFADQPKKPTQAEFQQKVQESQERQVGYKKQAAELFIQFNKAMADKTLPQNQNVFFHETEKEMLQKMIQLAMDINSDPNEEEGMGSLTWITLLFKTCLAQRDRINQMDFALTFLQKNAATTDYVKQEISKALDKKKDSE